MESMPNDSAIEETVSPGWIVYVVKAALAAPGVVVGSGSLAVAGGASVAAGISAALAAAAAVADGASVARASAWWRTSTLGVVERTTDGRRYAADAPVTPDWAAPETIAGYSLTRSAIAVATAISGSVRRSA